MDLKIEKMTDEKTGAPIWVMMPADYDPALVAYDDLLNDCNLQAFDRPEDAEVVMAEKS